MKRTELDTYKSVWVDKGSRTGDLQEYTTETALYMPQEIM